VDFFTKKYGEGTDIKDGKLEFYSPLMNSLIKPLIEKKRKEHETLFNEVGILVQANFSQRTIELYMEILKNKQTIEYLLEQDYNLLSISGLLTNIAQINVLRAKIEGRVKKDLESKIEEAEEKLNSAKKQLNQTYENIKSYQGFEWLIFAYTYLKDAETSVNTLRAREEVDSELFYQACLAIELCDIFTDFTKIVEAIDEKGKKAEDLKKSMKDFAFRMIQTAEYTLKTVQPEHVNNPEEEFLLLKTTNYYVPVMEKAFKEGDYLKTIDTAQQVIYNAEIIKAAFLQAPQSYIRNMITQKFLEFNQLILLTRQKGKFDAILPLFYYEKAAGPMGEPSKMIASANLSMTLIGVMEQELRPSAIFTT
jgi:predicted S18 family serine protease